MSDRRTCETCQFWRGKAGDYRSDCANPNNYTHRPAYDEGCAGWQGKPAAQPTVDTKTAVTPGWSQYLSKWRNQP